MSCTATRTPAVVLSPDGETDAFEILAGVLQGDTLAPYLFILVLDYVMRVAIGNDEDMLGFTVTPRKSRRHPAKVITNLDFFRRYCLAFRHTTSSPQLAVPN